MRKNLKFWCFDQWGTGSALLVSDPSSVNATDMSPGVLRDGFARATGSAVGGQRRGLGWAACSVWSLGGGPEMAAVGRGGAAGRYRSSARDAKEPRSDSGLARRPPSCFVTEAVVHVPERVSCACGPWARPAGVRLPLWSPADSRRRPHHGRCWGAALPSCECAGVGRWSVPSCGGSSPARSASSRRNSQVTFPSPSPVEPRNLTTDPRVSTPTS